MIRFLLIHKMNAADAGADNFHKNKNLWKQVPGTSDL